MERPRVTYENLLAGLLVKYGKANVYDMRVFIEDLERNYHISISLFAIDIRNIINLILSSCDNYYPLIGEDNLAKLKELQGDFIPGYLDSVNIDDITLQKIHNLGSVPEYSVSSVMNEEQEKAITRLYEKCLIVNVWNDDIPHEDYLEIQLTSLGEKRIFELEYKEEIAEFVRLLDSEGYDTGLLSDFLRVQDFRKGVFEILNIDNFLLFCSQYDRAARVDKDNIEVLKQLKPKTD